MDRYDFDIQLTTPTAKNPISYIYKKKKVTLFALLGDQRFIGFRGKSETRVWNEVECNT